MEVTRKRVIFVHAISNSAKSIKNFLKMETSNTNNNIAPIGYGKGYDRPLISITDEELLNKINTIDTMGMVELCDVRNELVARRYSLFNNDNLKLNAAIKPYAEMYKAKYL